MRTITIRYKYAGPEEKWRAVVGDFIAAVDNDPDVAGRFAYQVATADDRQTRTHWGRWDSQETLQKMQSRDYFKTFTSRLREIAGETEATASDVVLRTGGW